MTHTASNTVPANGAAQPADRCSFRFSLRRATVLTYACSLLLCNSRSSTANSSTTYPHASSRILVRMMLLAANRAGPRNLLLF
jgi:hypothetical protein